MSRSKPTVLIVEDEHALASALGASVTRLGALPIYAASGSKAIEAIAGGEVQVVVLDIGLPDMNGLEVIKRAFPDGVALPVLVVTAHGSLENAIAAKRLGVAEYLTKPLDLHGFEEVLGGLLSRPSGEASKDGGSGETGATMIGASPVMQRVFREVAHACTIEAPVVIGGASGTGKTLVAHVIHANREGGAGELKVLECGDADASKVVSLLGGAGGDGCSVLLENIDRMPADGQAALLSEVERGECPRLLSTARAPLHDAVSAGQFREDLYYRLRGIEIRLPRLAERREDIPALAAFFVGRCATDRALTISEDTLGTLSERDWSGNVRELANAIEYAASVCGGGRLLPQHLPQEAGVSLEQQGGLESALGRWLDARFASQAKPPAYGELIDEIEKAVLSKLLRRYGGKPTHLASELGLNRTTLRKRLERLDLS